MRALRGRLHPALPVEGATQAPVIGRLHRALPVEGATRVPVMIMRQKQAIHQIEAFFRTQTGGRACCYLPSARLGIYATLCELFPPGAGLVMSPVTDDIVLFTVLAAGLKPIFVDMDHRSGGLRPEAIPAAAATGIRGVLTSNLYGIPDDLPAIQATCQKEGLILIEDCAHALGSTVCGKAVGTFGEISIYSLAKKIHGRGGVVTGQNEAQVDAIRRHAMEYVNDLSPWVDAGLSIRLWAADRLDSFPSLKRLSKAACAPFLRHLPNPYPPDDGECNRGEGHRVPLREEDFVGEAARLGLDHYDRYIQVDNRQYREIPCGYMLYKMASALARFDETAHFCRMAADRIALSMPLQRGQVAENQSACFYKIPFFTKERAKHYRNLTAKGLSITCIYDPPFPDYLPPELFVNLVRDPAASRRWSREILPIAPEDIEGVNAYFREVGEDAER